MELTLAEPIADVQFALDCQGRCFAKAPDRPHEWRYVVEVEWEGNEVISLTTAPVRSLT